jgi:hypothetical protein
LADAVFGLGASLLVALFAAGPARGDATPLAGADLGSGSLVRADGARDEALATDIAVAIRPGGARVVVDQRFQVPAAATNGKSRFAFPLPPNAVVEAIGIKLGGKYMPLVWTEHVDLGRDAALPIVVSASLPSAPWAMTLETRIVYRDLPARDQGRYSFSLPLRIPTAIAAEGARVAALGTLPAVLVAAGTSVAAPAAQKARTHRPVRIGIDLDVGAPIARIGSPSHDFDHAPGGAGHMRIMVGGDSVPVDRDFVLVWTVAGEPAE